MRERISGIGCNYLRTLQTSAERRKRTETVALNGSETWQANNPWSQGSEGESVTASWARYDDKSHQFLIYRLTKWSRPKYPVGAENSLGMFELPLNKEHSELIYFLKCHRTEKLPPTLSARYALDWR